MTISANSCSQRPCKYQFLDQLVATTELITYAPKFNFRRFDNFTFNNLITFNIIGFPYSFIPSKFLLFLRSYSPSIPYSDQNYMVTEGI